MSVSSRSFQPLSRTSLCIIILCILNIPRCSALEVRPKADDKLASVAKYSNALPMSFEQNQGQADSEVRFISRATGISAFFKASEADFLLSSQSTGIKPAPVDLLRMELLHANNSANISGAMQLPGTVNYFLGSEPAKWHAGVPTFEQVKYAGIYPGVDLVYYGNQGRLEFDFQLAPGADAGAIQFRFDGSRKLKLDREGNLVVTAPNGDVSFQRPLVYREGSHAADAQDMVKSISIDNKGNFKVGDDISAYRSEQRAYGVTDAIYRSANEPYSGCASDACKLGAGSSPIGIPGRVDAILLANPKIYHSADGKPLTSTNQGGNVLNLTIPH